MKKTLDTWEVCRELNFTCVKVEVNPRLWNEFEYWSSPIHGLQCVNSLSV